MLFGLGTHIGGCATFVVQVFIMTCDEVVVVIVVTLLATWVGGLLVAPPDP